MIGMHTSTVALESAPSPRVFWGRPWIPSFTAATLGVVLVVLERAIGALGYQWAVVTAVAVLAMWLAWIDERTFTLPNRWVGALAAFGCVQVVGSAFAPASTGPALGAVGAAVIVTVIYVGLGFAGAVGFGDVKFAAALTLAVGSVAGLIAVYLAQLAFAVSAVRIMARKARGADPRHPHGTSLAVAGISVLLFAATI
ncbi:MULTISPECIES: A24 family peptidase [unclassified Microbacterium]|uniref:A24 family peptidase n=1 Tax=unclassified Microbacterium TaxID=2609290 RepID=UPI00301ADC81